MVEESDKNSKDRTEKKVVLWWIYLLIGFVASVVVGSMGYLFYVGNHITVVHTPLICAAMEIRIEVTTAHLWFEEILGGDRQESIDTVRGHLDEADWYAQAMLEGGENPPWKYSPVNDAGIRREIENFQMKLAEFRAITEERFKAPADSLAGSEIDQKYDGVFAELMNMTEQIEMDIKRMISRELRNFSTVQTTLIFICVAVTVLVGIIYSRIMRRQIRDGLELHAANQQLLASEEELRKEHEFLNDIFESLTLPFYVVDANDYTLKMANSAAHSGSIPTEATCYKLMHKRDKPCEEAEHPCPIKHLKKTKKLITVEHIHYDKDGRPRNIEVHAYPIIDTYGNVSQIIEHCIDITERKRAEQQVKASLEEKEVLLKEIHHRVKNNLQIIVSLLSLQSEYVKDKQAVELFRESQFRVKSMALLHERLYETEDLAHINFSDYIRDLTDELLSSYGTDAGNIKLKINVKDVFPSVDVAVPCALIINELVSNCLKHAFPKGRSGEIRIEFDSEKQDNYTLSISDNGVGFAKDVDFPDGRTLGLQLVSTLAEQLQGSVVLDKSAGTSFKISFSKLQ